MTEKTKLKVLVVDDEKVIRDFLSRFLSLQLAQVKTAADGEAAIELAKTEEFDLVFLDIRMPKMNGLETFGELKKITPDLACVFMTGYASAEEDLINKIKYEGIMCVRKPFENLNKIKEIVENVLKEASLAPDKKNDDPKQKRAYQRLDIALAVDYRIKGKTGAFSHCLSNNISLGGIRLLAPEELSVGTKLDLVIKSQDNKNTCVVPGEVVWARKSESKAGHYEAGVKFSEININQLSGLMMSIDDKSS
ncbi:MAG TPA: hypothetical protein DEA99_05005 [Candidatus Omnitrophica bacterium]|nr:hypothetical protein [Candidatus Omnitrophota bacterium]